MHKMFLVILAALLLAGCASQFNPYIDATLATIDGERRSTLARLEDRRCKRPLHWVEDLANIRGDTWLMGYIQSCPNWRGLILRISAMRGWMPIEGAPVSLTP